MITKTALFKAEIPIFPSDYGLTEKTLFFDIETTGLSAFSSSVYLIGVLYFRNGLPYTCQWLAESFSEELKILRTFFAFAEAFDTLVSFNGDGFDLRYLMNCAEQYHLPCSLDRLKSLDLMKECRKVRKLTGLKSLRQKSIECFLGIEREDRFSGGELIPVYEHYTKEKKKEQLDLLLLHNLEDIQGMLRILPMLSLSEFVQSPNCSGISMKRLQEGSLLIRAALNRPLPVHIDYEFSSGNRLTIDQATLTVTIPVFYGTLRLFYPDYRSYSFLPDEGYAIHNKVASFVGAGRKIPATRETCYTLFTGEFIPAPFGPVSAHLFREEYRSKAHYLNVSDLDPNEYLKAELKELQGHTGD